MEQNPLDDAIKNQPQISRFGPQDIETIRTRFATGESKASLMKAFKASRKTIEKVVIGVSQEKNCQMLCENKTQTYRENLNWALDAAGQFLMTGTRPKTCPNSSAWFLYTQACAEPKDFMAKVNQIESKDMNKGDSGEEVKKGSKKALSDIEKFLSNLLESENGEA